MHRLFGEMDLGIRSGALESTHEILLLLDETNWLRKKYTIMDCKNCN